MYIIVFSFTALMALWQPTNRPWKSLSIWIPMAIFLIIYVGLRHEVGSDWLNYINMFFVEVSHMNYTDALHQDDPLFYLLMVWVYKMGWTIHVVDLVCGILFVTGLVIFVRRMPNPWLALTIAVSYTVLTLGMGYMRHGAALGLSLWAIILLIDRKFIRFAILIVIAAGFHKSAVLMMGLGLFAGGKSKYLKAFAAIAMMVGVYVAFVSGNEETYVRLYIEGDMTSGGAIIRTFMNVVAALFFLYFRKRWKRLWPESYMIWLLMALASVVIFPLVFAYSTAVDRISLYAIPLQFVIFSHLPILLQGKLSPRLTTLLVIAYYGLVYFVWLNFASWAFAWIPYQSILPAWLGVYF